MLIALAANGAVCGRPACLPPALAWVVSRFDIRCRPGGLPAGAAAMADSLIMVLIPSLLLRIVTNPSHLHDSPQQEAIVTALHSTAAVFTRHRPMTTTTTTTPGQRALLLGWAAAFTLAKGLAWVVVLALVLARLDGFIPRKPATPASDASMESMESMALVAIADLRAAADADLAAAADEIEAAVEEPVTNRCCHGRSDLIGSGRQVRICSICSGTQISDRYQCH